MSLASEVCFRIIARNLPRRKDRLIAMIFLKTKEVENIVRFGVGGPEAEKTTFLEF